jgi:hypothetical protein
MVSTLSTDQRDDYLVKLLEFSTRAWWQKYPGRSQQAAQPLSPEEWLATLDLSPVPEQQFGDETEDLTSHQHAPPLLPIRERDMTVLHSFFDRQDIDAIEADILNNLETRVPEPCWDEAPLEFLQGYL